MKRTLFADVEISPTDVADMFCALDSEQQATFFNEVARISDLWQGTFLSQMMSVMKSTTLSADGQAIMQEIGKAGEP